MDGLIDIPVFKGTHNSTTEAGVAEVPPSAVLLLEMDRVSGARLSCKGAQASQNASGSVVFEKQHQ